MSGQQREAFEQIPYPTGGNMACEGWERAWPADMWGELFHNNLPVPDIDFGVHSVKARGFCRVEDGRLEVCPEDVILAVMRMASAAMRMSCTGVRHDRYDRTATVSANFPGAKKRGLPMKDLHLQMWDKGDSAAVYGAKAALGIEMLSREVVKGELVTTGGREFNFRGSCPRWFGRDVRRVAGGNPLAGAYERFAMDLRGPGDVSDDVRENLSRSALYGVLGESAPLCAATVVGFVKQACARAVQAYIGERRGAGGVDPLPVPRLVMFENVDVGSKPIRQLTEGAAGGERFSANVIDTISLDVNPLDAYAGTLFRVGYRLGGEDPVVATRVRVAMVVDNVRRGR